VLPSIRSDAWLRHLNISVDNRIPLNSSKIYWLISQLSLLELLFCGCTPFSDIPISHTVCDISHDNTIIYIFPLYRHDIPSRSISHSPFGLVKSSSTQLIILLVNTVNPAKTVSHWMVGGLYLGNLVFGNLQYHNFIEYLGDYTGKFLDKYHRN
jgi:hypothetical protein